jgi:DNA-binding beta-propeller fold protein YncE
MKTNSICARNTISFAGTTIACASIIGMAIFSLAGCSRGIAKTEAKTLAPAVEYVGSWGAKGDAPGQMKAPAGIATDSFGDVYIADAGNQFIEKFDPKGKPLLSFQEDALKQPQSIAIDGGGGIYVTDPVRASVFVFFPEGDRYRELRLRTKSSSENELSVAIGDDGRVHVLDADSGKVFNFAPPPFRMAPSWLVPVSAPNSKARRGPIVAGPDGYIYVADPAGNRVLRFSEDGQLVSEIDLTPSGTGDRVGGPFAVYSGHIFLMSADGHTLHILVIDGSQQRTDIDLEPELGPDGGTVSALAVSSHRQLFVLDGPHAQVLGFQLNF